VRDFILNLFDSCYLIQLRWLASLFKFYFRHIKTKIGLHNIRFYILKEERFILIIPLRLCGQVFWNLIFKQWMLKDLLPCNPFFCVDCQHSLNQQFYFLIPFYISELQRLVQNILFEFREVLTVPGRPAVEHLIENNPNRPDIALGRKLTAS
jgi:hypothetical protein